MNQNKEIGGSFFPSYVPIHYTVVSIAIARDEEYRSL